MTYNVRRYNVNKEFASNRGKQYWTIVPSYLWVKIGDTYAAFQCPQSPNIKGTITKLVCFKKMAFTRSDPHALWVLSVNKKLKILSSVMLNWPILGCGNPDVIGSLVN